MLVPPPGRLNGLKEEVVWVDTEQNKEEPLLIVKETKIGEDAQVVEETKKESSINKESDMVTAGTFGFQGEVVKSEEKSMVG